MANFMSLPFELRVMVYKYLLTEEVQPTACKYPHKIPICNASERISLPEQIRKEAYSVYLASNNIILKNSRLACLWLERISPYFSTQAKQSLHITFDLRHDCNRPVGRNNTRKADQKRFFQLLAPHTKLDLTLKSRGHLVAAQFRSGAMHLMHGFASATLAPTPAVASRCAAHHNLDTKAVENAMTVVGRKVTACRELLDLFTAACSAGCEHLADGGTWNSQSTIHLDVRGLKGDPTNCFFCFAEGI